MRRKPGEGSTKGSKGLLRDCEIFGNIRITFVVSSTIPDQTLLTPSVVSNTAHADSCPAGLLLEHLLGQFRGGLHERQRAGHHQPRQTLR